jgi:hypothetical protein
MENILPTAEETRLKYIPNGCVNIKGKGLGDGKLQKKYEDTLLDQMLIEFAKLHVEAALKAASNKAEATLESSGDEEYPIVIKNSILNSYSLNNIK